MCNSDRFSKVEAQALHLHDEFWLDPYGYNGSPLSGRVDMQGYCDCGWGGYIMYSGWRIRSEALKSTQKADAWRLHLFKLKGGQSATVKELLEWLSQ